MKHAVQDGVRLNVRTVGHGDREVLFVHGFLVSGCVFDDVVPQLAGPDRTLCIPDLRGAGQSDRPASGYTLDRYAADLWSLVETLELDQPVLVGHSMGGQIAQRLATLRPDEIELLVLINPVPAAGLELPAEVRHMFRSCGGDAEAIGSIVDMSCLAISAGARTRLIADAVATSAACVSESLDAWTAGGFADDLARITAETHVVATSDRFLPPAFLQQAVVDLIDGARLHVLEGPGHYPMVESPGKTAELLQSLLSPQAVGVDA